MTSPFTLSSTTDVSPFSPLANKPDPFQTFAKWAGPLFFFPVLIFIKLKQLDKLRCGLLLCVPVGLEGKKPKHSHTSARSSSKQRSVRLYWKRVMRPSLTQRTWIHLSACVWPVLDMRWGRLVKIDSTCNLSPHLIRMVDASSSLADKHFCIADPMLNLLLGDFSSDSAGQKCPPQFCERGVLQNQHSFIFK